MQKFSFFILFFIFTAIGYAQNLRESTIHFEQSTELEGDVSEAFVKQANKKFDNAALAYQRIFNEYSSGQVVKYRPTTFKELLILEKIIKLYKERKFSFQKQKIMLRKTDYIPEIFFKFPPMLISLKQLKTFAKWYRKGGSEKLWQNYQRQTAMGYYVGIDHYLQSLLVNLPKDLYKKLLYNFGPSLNVLKEKDPIKFTQSLQKIRLYRGKILDALGGFYFSQGKLGQAIGMWQKILYLKLQDVSKEQITAQIAVAAFLNRDIALYRKKVSKNKDNTVLVSFADKKIPLNQFLQKIPKHFQLSKNPINWCSVGGNFSHSLQAPSFFPSRELTSSNPKWRYTKFSRWSNDVFLPLQWNNFIYYRTSNYLMCLDINKNLRVAWRFNFPATRWDKVKKNNLHALTLHNGVIYFFGSRQYSQLFHPSMYAELRKRYNTLYALDASTGKLVWSWPHPETDVTNTNIHFNLAPVVVGKKIFASATVVTGETNSEVFCFSIHPDKKTESKRFGKAGKLLWRQFVSSALEQSHNTRHYQATLGAGITAAYGMLYCCSNLGVVAALDLHTGAIRWLNNYSKHSRDKYQLRNNCKPRNVRWQNMAPIAKNGKLYVTPVDTDKLLIYDCFSGALQRSFPEKKQNNELNRLMGVADDGTVYLAGPAKAFTTKIVALQEQNKSEILWQKLIPEKIVGQGLLTHDALFLITHASVYKINNKNGRKKLLLKTAYNKRPHFVLSFLRKKEKYLLLSGREIAIYQEK